MTPAFVIPHPPGGALKPLSAEARAALLRAKKERTAEAILAAKRALAKESRYSCCITEGGCNECLKEGVCACGPQLNEKKGVCQECVTGWKVGMGKFEGISASDVRLAVMGGGSLGSWPMTREGSGTSWQPDASPMFAWMGERGGATTMLQGALYATVTRTTGYTNGQGMAMAWGTSRGVLYSGRLMLSPDPLTVGRNGYPLPFQSGEGLFNRQHPHDFVGELAVSAAARNAFIYLAPVGEPALGPSAYVHRPSALENPEAPLSHHFLDSTHITHGVVTAGWARATAKLEASLFNPKEPDNNRWRPDGLGFGARSVRLSVNPTDHWSAQVSGATIGHERRTIVSVGHAGEQWQSLLALAVKRHEGKTRTASLLETTRYQPQGSLFARAEWVHNDELPGNAQGAAIGKVTVGGVKAVSSTLGVGASLSLHRVPSNLRPQYGSQPWSANLFLRWRAPRQ